MNVLDWFRKNIRAARGRARLMLAMRHEPLRVVVGAGGTSFEGWISTDIDTLDLLDPRSWQRCLGDRRIEVILAEHVWEYFSRAEASRAAECCHRFLVPGGYLRAAVPDGNHPDRDYLAQVGIGRAPMVSAASGRVMSHQVLYDYRSFSEVFSRAGFEVTLLEYFDEHGAFHENAWDPADGMIRRSKRFDRRNAGGALNYTSIILDARVPGGS